MRHLALHLLTTSSSKAAHLRYLFRQQQIEVRSWNAFRGYPELQGEKARDSLQLGAEYLRQHFSKPFIIEDTEVRLEAYSKGSHLSYPGFDVKRWWRVTTFREIDEKCKSVGTRAVSQSSNICISIPDMKLLFFRGTILGEIALAPYAGEPRPQAPWLNPGEFGSIFIPKGAPGPFASLSIEESLRYDFRARAVKRAAAKIIELEAILNLDQTCCWSDEEHTHNSDQLELFQSGNQEVNAAD